MDDDAQRGTRLLVTGLGPITCLGLGIDEVAESISAMRMVRSPQELLHRRLPHGGLLPRIDLDEFLECRRPHPDERDQYVLAAGVLALENAAAETDEVEVRDCGLAIASIAECGPQAARAVLSGSEGERAVSETDCQVLAAELDLDESTLDVRGHVLSGALAIRRAATLLSDGSTELMVAGGVDLPDKAWLDAFWDGGNSVQVRPAQGVGLLVLETEDAVERREGYAYCELGAASYRPVPSGTPLSKLSELLSDAVTASLEAAGAWEGDVGVVFSSTARDLFPDVGEAEREALSGFSEVPNVTTKQFVGETFSAGFPMECILAADTLNARMAPPRMSFAGIENGVEFWVERPAEPLMGDCALVVGSVAGAVAVVVLRCL